VKDDPTPRWRQDFPIHWENDHYVTRRELAKFLTLGSGLLVGASALVAIVGKLRRSEPFARMRIEGAAKLGAGECLLFRYPTDRDPCILLRHPEGRLVAYSQVCTHLSCAVVHRPERDALFCPCHQGVFSTAEGVPTEGPPTRRLPRIRLEEQAGEVYAVGVEL
jgi:nitrite reductase/ring-hydroxylating ferredoxin subunit